MLNNLLQMKKLLFVLLLSISSVVNAQWTLVSQGSSSLLYVDKSSIQQNGLYIRAWIRNEYFANSEAEIVGKMRSTRELNEFDCRQKRARGISFQAFKEPNLINSYPQDNTIQEWMFIAPGMKFNTLINIVCKK